MKLFYYHFLTSVLLIGYGNIPVQEDLIPPHDTFEIVSKQVKETRTINVWTPADYKTTSKALPVMYMADGGVKEDFPHIANTLAALIMAKKIPPMILVGIENTQRRRDLTGFTKVEKDKKIAPVVGGSAKFRAFISEELFTEINKRYRTTTERSLIGESLSGLFVIETLFLKQDLFNHYIAFDPSLWWNNHDLVETANDHLKNLPAIKKSIWFAGSDTEDISLYTKSLAVILKAKNLPNLKWNYSDEPKEKHNTIFKATKEKAIIWTFGTK